MSKSQNADAPSSFTTKFIAEYYILAMVFLVAAFVLWATSHMFPEKVTFWPLVAGLMFSMFGPNISFWVAKYLRSWLTPQAQLMLPAVFTGASLWAALTQQPVAAGIFIAIAIFLAVVFAKKI